MATTVDARLVTANTRDGVDTRKQDLTTRVGASHDRDEQTAAFLMPPGADVSGTAMNIYWGNYLRTAEAYVKGDPNGFFHWTSFSYQQGLNEADLQGECRKLGLGEEMLNIYRQNYNAALTEHLCEPSDLTLKFLRRKLDLYNKEVESQHKAALRIQKAFKTRTGHIIDTQSTEMTAELMNLVNRAINVAGRPEWDAYWAKFQAKPTLRIRKPNLKRPCFRGCGSESTTRVRGRNMCHPCSDFTRNVGECCECGVVGPRLAKDVICEDCYDAELAYRMWYDSEY